MSRRPHALAGASVALALAGSLSGACVQYEEQIDEFYGEPCEKLRSGYVGDELCMLPPDPADGFQLHFGPSDYDDADDVDRFLIQPGEENVRCMTFEAPTDDEFFVDSFHVRMRGGTHHLLLYASTSPDVVVHEGRLHSCQRDASWVSFAGSQSALGPEGGIVHIPDPDAPVPPEDEGGAVQFAAGTKLMVELHYVNVTAEPILREAWINLEYAEPGAETSPVGFLAFIGGLGMEVPAFTTQVVPAGGCGIPPWGPDSVRIRLLNAHMHAHGQRMSVWKVTEEGERTLIYETFDWEHPLFAYYNSLAVNPEPGVTEGVDGAYSGILELEKGDVIEYECEFANDLDQPLVFANEAYTAEMCNLFGSYSPSMGGPLSCFTW